MKSVPGAVNQFISSISRVMPEGLTSELEKNLRAAMNAAFERMDLVTREELEVQEAVLARTREKLDKLEKEVEKLTGKLDR